MPKLWAETIETHRSQLRDAVLERTAALIAEHGVRAVTMSQIAADTGIGRATLYKYFPDVESILLAWHERQVAAHLDHLEAVRRRASDPEDALRAVFSAYASLRHQMGRHDDHPEVRALLHGGERLAGPEQQLHELFRGLIAEAAELGAVRTDADPGELATYALNALMAAGEVRSGAAAKRIVAITISGLRNP